MTEETNAASAGGDAGASVPETADTANETALEAEAKSPEENAGDEGQRDDAAENGEVERPKRNQSGSAKLRARLDYEIAEKAVLAERLRILEAAQNGQGQTAQQQETPPREEDFNGDYFAYLKAQAVFEARQSMRGEFEQIRTQAERERQARAEQESNASYANRVNEFRKGVSDYDDVMAEADDVPVSAAMVDVIRSSDKGPALAYWLAKNPDTATSIANMPPLLAARELGRLEASISQTKPRTESRAPSPIRPVSGRAQIQKSPDDMSMEEYMAFRRGKN